MRSRKRNSAKVTANDGDSSNLPEEAITKTDPIIGMELEIEDDEEDQDVPVSPLTSPHKFLCGDSYLKKSEEAEDRSR